MSKINFVIVFISIISFSVYAQLSPSEELSSKNANCEEECSKSFAPHTYPNGTDSSACMQGCRLYIINKFLAAINTDETNIIESVGPSSAKGLCFDACNEAYNETSSNTAACKVGCTNQEDILQENEGDKPADVSGLHSLKPVMQVREVINKVVGMLHIIQSTITTYFISDDNKLVAVEGPVKLMVQVVPPELEEQETETRQQKDALPQGGLLVNGASSFECFSRRVGVPPYLLVVSLFSFIISLAYLIFIICSSSKKQKVKSGLPIPSHALPVKLVRPEDLTKLSLIDEEECQQALPLPTKVKLPDTII